MGNEPKWQGYYPNLAESFGGPGDNYMGDDFAGYGRFDYITAGEDFKTLCECRLDQRWAGRHGHGMPRNPNALQLLQGLQRMQGTDAPSDNTIFLRNDSPGVGVTAKIEYGSGAGNGEFYCSVGAGSHLFVPATYWRISMRVDLIAVGDAPAYPPVGTRVLVGAAVGRGTGAHNTRPHLDVYVAALAGIPRIVPVPARADSFEFHFGPTLAAAASLTEVGLGGATLATWRGPLVQDKKYQIFSAVREIVFDPDASPVSGVFRFWLV